MFHVQCLESKTETATSLYSKFSIGPLLKGQGTTVGNALRRVLLSNLEGIAITGVRIVGVNHEFSSIKGIKEDIVEVLLNLKQIVLKGNLDDPIIARLVHQGQGIVTAKNIQLPDNISVIEERQYIATITSAISLEMEFIIGKGEGYSTSEKTTSLIPPGFLAIDSVYMPVKKVNFFVETSENNISLELENLILEIYTNGSIEPIVALSYASDLLEQIFSTLRITNSPIQKSLAKKSVTDEKQQELDRVMIEDLELSVRAYNCLKRADIHSLADLLKYSQEELLEFKNFGQKSADEVMESLKTRFNKTLRKQ
jgi:DNA-directed RNA polymerase subunit alpha